ncbi:MAG: ribonuclease Y [Gemmatimonadales bacterium]
MMDTTLMIAVIGGLVVGVPIGMFLWNMVLVRSARSLRALSERAQREGAELVAAAERDATVVRERQVVEAREEAVAIKEEAAREAARRRDEVDKAERRVADREAQVGERQDRLRTEEKAVEQRRGEFAAREQGLMARQAELTRLHAEVQQRLERVAGLTAEDAAREVRQQVEDEARTQAAAAGREIRERAKREADKAARRLLAITTQRLAAEHTAESTVSAVALPNDEMKGRIIGREGRNIRAFELATGVDVIIDDTPDTVVISCFDPVRREVARRALDALVVDGRIHPGRIEEVVVKAKAELDAQLIEMGERAAHDVGVHGLHPELIRLIGRMRYRSSYGQNLYEHSKEVAWLAGMMAAELKLDVALARRGGLLHDIGKVLTHEHEGTHVQLGVEVCRRHGESAAVLNCIEAHHDDVPHDSSESVLVQASDSVSGSRPGARREAFETYVKRLTKLEEIAGGYPGVEKTTVIQAGREVRVIVQPEKIDDAAAQLLSETIARRIEQELQYPGQIRVTVIRETRATDVAK